MESRQWTGKKPQLNAPAGTLRGCVSSCTMPGATSRTDPPKVLCRRTENYLYVQLAVKKVAPKQPISLVAYRKTGPAKRKTPVWSHYSRQRSLSTAKRPTSVRELMGGGRGRRDDRRLYYSGSLLHFSIEMDAQDNLLVVHSRIRHGGRFPWLDSEASWFCAEYYVACCTRNSINFIVWCKSHILILY